MSESLGLSIGTANLVAARAGGDAVTRRSVLTLFDQQPSEVGLPAENSDPATAGLVMRGFVERVGDRTPLVAADGTKYLGDALTVEALEAMARTVDYGTPVTIAVPAYWSPEQSAALREEFFAQPGLAPGGVPPVLISDATAALTALRAEPDFPTEGIVALCDFGASGTTVTLSDAGSDFAQIGPSVRDRDFSGDAIDQLILDHLREAIPSDSSGGVASTTRMGSLARLLDQCRRAKEDLSTAPVTTLPAVTGEDVELSRNEFEELLSGPLDEFVTDVQNLLQRNDIDNLAAVATVGGGAAIPLLATRLSERLGVPVRTAPQPAFSAALGAAAFGQQHPATTAMASPAVENPTQLASAVPADMTQVMPEARIEEERPLAWSEDEDEQDPVPYTGPEHSGQYVRDAMDFEDEDGDPDAAASPLWYQRPIVVLSLAAAAAAIVVAVVLALTLGEESPSPVQPSPSRPTAPPTEQTVTITDTPTGTVTTPPPPPPSTTTTEAPVTTTEVPTTTYQPPPTTTYQPPVTTTPPAPTTTFTPPVEPTRERRWPWRRY